jgi:hypothetical protein
MSSHIIEFPHPKFKDFKPFLMVLQISSGAYSNSTVAAVPINVLTATFDFDASAELSVAYLSSDSCDFFT